MANQEKGRSHTGPSKCGFMSPNRIAQGRKPDDGCSALGAGGFLLVREGHHPAGSLVSDWEGGPIRKATGTQRLSGSFMNTRPREGLPRAV